MNNYNIMNKYYLCKIIYSSRNSARNGVEKIIDGEMKSNEGFVGRRSDKIITVKLIFAKKKNIK